MGAPKRQYPADFAAHAATLTRKELRLMYRAGYTTIDRWIAEIAAPMRPRYLPLPADFATVAGPMLVKQIMAHYGVSRSTVRRWLELVAIEKSTRHKLPADIAEIVADRSISAAAKHLGWNESTLGKALKRERPDLHKLACANGMAAMAALRRPVKRVVEPTSPTRKPTGWKLPMPKDLQTAATSQADLAMRWLQGKVGYCYPLRIYGSTLPGYRMRGRIWQANELIAEAKRMGWQPDAWRELAA